jgi:hypothetical protein
LIVSVVAIAVVATAGIVLIIVNADGDAHSRSQIRAGLAEVPTGDPSKVGEYLAGPPGTLLHEATQLAYQVVDADDVCATARPIEDIGPPMEVSIAAVGVPDQALSQGYGAMLVVLDEISQACVGDGAQAVDPSEVDRLQLILVALEERLDALKID